MTHPATTRAIRIAVLMALLAALAACGAVAPTPTATPWPTKTPTATATATPAPPPAPAPDLAGLPAGVWQLVRIEYPSGKVVTIEQPQKYTVQFVGNGRLQIQADCNGGSGVVDVQGEKLAIGALVTTKMACGPGSQDQVFLSALHNAAAYIMDGEEFIISQAFDGGELVFRRAP